MPQEGLGNGLFKWKSFPLEVGWKGRPLVFPLWNRLFCLKIPLAKALARGSKDKYSSWHTQGYAGCIYLLRKIQSQIWISTLRILFLTLTHSAGRFVITPTQSTQKLKSRIKKEKLFNSRIKKAGEWKSQAGEGDCCQVRWPEFDSPNPTWWKERGSSYKLGFWLLHTPK